MKKSKILLSIGSITAVVAPIATTVACGNKKHITAGASQAHESGLYTLKAIRDEATRIGNTAHWRHGITYESTMTSISLLRAFAEFCGYDSEQFFAKNGVSTINDDNTVIKDRAFNFENNFDEMITGDKGSQLVWGHPLGDIKNNHKNAIEKFKHFSAKTETPNEQDKKGIDLVLGDSDRDNEWSLNTKTWVKTDGQVFGKDWKNKPDGDDLKVDKDVSLLTYSWTDAKHPGDEVVDLYDRINRVNKLVKVHNVMETYPIIKPEEKQNFKPFIEEAIKIFSEQFPPVASLAASQVKIYEQVEMFNYISQKYPTGIPQEKFDAFWNVINNGSLNLQAVKIALLGLNLTGEDKITKKDDDGHDQVITVQGFKDFQDSKIDDGGKYLATGETRPEKGYGLRDFSADRYMSGNWFGETNSAPILAITPQSPDDTYITNLKNK